MFVVYGIMRFVIEFIRDDNPFEISILTISQLIGLALIAFGILLMILFSVLKAGKSTVKADKSK